MGGSAPSFSARAEPIPSRFVSLIPGGKLGSGSTKGGRVLTTCRQLIGVTRGRHDIHAEWCQTTGDSKPLVVSLVIFLEDGSYVAIQAVPAAGALWIPMKGLH